MRRPSLYITSAILMTGLAGCMSEEPAPGTKVYTKQKRGATVLSGGVGYHGANLTEVPAANEPSPRPRPVTVANGKLPVPTQYPLSPDDTKLWNTLTIDQQKRALLFLQDGSTIAASLRTE